MIIIKMDKELENYDIERLGQLYKKQIEEGVVVLPKGSELEDTVKQALIKLPSVTIEEIKPTWIERLFGYKPLRPLEVEEVGHIDFNQPVKPKPPGN